ncbi:TIP41-like protein [Trichoplax sp. H2]|nr:TIP41-like protein [Trichoplax sp. H2]|eukprot:RDD46878.1 TIP41-like protein [Trichoplax sp. H2]
MEQRKINVRKDEFTLGPWKLISTEGSILKSACSQPDICQNQSKKCELCTILSAIDIPLPEMLFANNSLRLEHRNGFGIEFNPTDALKLVNNQKEHIKVAYAEEWQKNRVSSEDPVNETVKRFDWTYSSKYKGTLFGDGIKASSTTQRIDIEKLKAKEKIYHYKSIMLFEDELADNGCAWMNAKVRVMPGYVFFLLRFFLRVDNVLARVYDTRLYHQAETNYMLREFLAKECNLQQVKVPSHVLSDPAEIDKFLTVTEEQLEVVSLPIL